jgi:AbrB family looped-hinge helix DNA binding protein
MTRVTSKLQVTIPKAIAEQYGIEPGGEIDWLPAGEAIRVVPNASKRAAPDLSRRVELFDRASERQLLRQNGKKGQKDETDRGWRREDVYVRGGAG